MRGRLAAVVATVVFAVMAAPASAGVTDGVRVSREGERLVVSGPADMVHVWIRGGAGGDVVVGTALPTRIESLPVDCLPAGANEVTCPSWRSAVVDVRLGEGYDLLELRDVPLPVDATTGAGDDLVLAGLSDGHDRLDLGAGHDTVSWADRPDGRGVVVRGLGARGGEDQVGGAERLRTTPAADDVATGEDAEVVDTGGGNDRVDLRDGRTNRVDCGGQSGDMALADADDEVTCTIVQRPPGAPPAPGAPPPSPLRAGHADLVATPRHHVGSLHLVLRAAPAQEAAVRLSAGAWSAAAPDHALEARTATADGDGVARVALALPEPMRAALEADGRLRVTGELRVGESPPRPVAFTVFAWRKPRLAPVLTLRRGGFGPERLFGSEGGDLIGGASGDDLIDGRAASDHLLGGTGNDRVFGAHGDDVIDGGDGDDQLVGGPGADDLVEHRFGDDLLDGGDGDDVLHGARGGDRLRGGAGDDVLTGGSGSDALDCGPGQDIAFVNFIAEETRVAGCEEVYDEPGVVHLPCSGPGTAGNETMLGSEGADTCAGLAGSDDLEGRGGDDVLDAGEGDDRLFGRFGADRLLGGPGRDELEGGRGTDLLDGGEGDDALNGGLDGDWLFGGPGDDRVTARGGGVDRVDCGPGRDTAVVDSRDRVAGCERVLRSRPKR